MKQCRMNEVKANECRAYEELIKNEWQMNIEKRMN